MMTRRIFTAVLLGGASMLALPGCSLFEPSEILRYRLTVTVETPQGLRSGYSVWELKLTAQKIGVQIRSDYRAEAVALDLPNGETIFALLQGGDQQPEYPIHVIVDEIRRSSEIPNWHRDFLELFPVWQRGHKSWTVPRWKPHFHTNSEARSAYPLLVTFKDIKDPSTAERVDPDDLSASFGAGYRLKSITVTATDEQVTTGIQSRLAWLPTVYQSLKGNDFKPEGIPVGNFQGLFSTERF